MKIMIIKKISNKIKNKWNNTKKTGFSLKSRE